MTELRIKPDSPAGRFMLGQGVSRADLEAATIKTLNRQFGHALTVTWPWGGATIYLKESRMPNIVDGEIAVDDRLPLLRHELVHVEQGRKWGFAGYWARHLWARVRHRSVLAQTSAAERPAYEAQAAAHLALASAAAVENAARGN